MPEISVKRSKWLVFTGWLLFFTLYLGQVGLFVAILIEHLDSRYGWWCLCFLPAFVFIFLFFYEDEKLKYAKTDDDIFAVWIVWGLYIMAYVATVLMIFIEVAHKLTKEHTLGINALIGTLCITPPLLILLLQLTICPSYRKPVLSLSIFAALNIFDGIEMLEIFLMQTEDFDLNSNAERSIVVFACICFLLSSIGLVRNKFGNDGEVKERGKTSMILGLLEIFGTNLPFLVIRAVIWHKYEAAIFIAKNVVSLVIGAVEILVLTGLCKCGIEDAG